MPELNDNDLRKLFRAAGRSKPGIDLTDRIMARVAVTPIHRPLEVKPLIGKAGWSAIGALIVMIVLVLINLGSTSAESSLLDPIHRELSRIQLPSFSLSEQWLYWSAAIAGLAFLYSLMDRILERRLH